MKSNFIHFLVILFLPLTISAQSGELLTKKEIKKMEMDGEYYFEDGEYDKALGFFLELDAVKPDDPYYNLVIGICYSFLPSEKEKSISRLEKAQKLNPELQQSTLYLGRAYFVNNRYDDAITSMTTFLQGDDVNEEEESMARKVIAYCENAKVYTSDSLDVEIYNMGNVINSPADEYVPLITPDESMMIFTYRGEKSTGGRLNDYHKPDKQGNYFEDIYVSYKSPDDWMYDEDVWLEPVGIDSLNTDYDDACVALTIDGQTLFIYKYSKETGGDIYQSQLDGKDWQTPEPVKGEVNTKYWEGSVTIASDGQVMYFASDKPGGFGGRDLYRAEKLEDDSWGNVVNLGSTINTPFNEDAPYLHLDQQTLYFSSEGHNSMGGYDVFYSERQGDGWGVPTNMGCPVNTTEDDRFYVATADGSKGYYSSSFGVNSQGNQDIYAVTPDPGKINSVPVAALIIGTVYADEVPTGSTINLINETENKTAGEFKSNTESGDYRIALLPGSKYRLEVEVDNYPLHVDNIDLEGLNSYIEVSNNIHVYSDKFLEENEIAAGDQALQDELANAIAGAESTVGKDAVVPVVPGTPDSPDTPVDGGDKGKTAIAVVPVVPIPDKDKDGQEVTDNGNKDAILPPPVAGTDDPCDDQFVDMSPLIGKDLNVEDNYNELLGMVGNYCADNLEFVVQIGAYRFPKNFKYQHLAHLGETKVKGYPDGITRFTMGDFVTLQEADALRKTLMSSGVKDAWVVPFFDGQRLFMEELIKVNFYNRSVN